MPAGWRYPMADLTDDIAHALREDDTPDTPYEHKICGLTLLGALAFLAAALFYGFSPADAALKNTVVAIAAGLFALILLSFFVSAFAGKFCGSKRT